MSCVVKTHSEFNMKPYTICLMVLFLIFALFGGLAGHITYKDITKCDNYHTDIWATMTFINYTNITDYGILYCNECQNGGSFLPCPVVLEQNMTGSCHINKNKKCISDGDFTWTDENNMTYHESYNSRNKYNSLQRCFVDEFQAYHFTIGIDYELNGQNQTGHFRVNCDDSWTSEICFVHVIQSYIVNDDVLISVNKNDNSIRLDLDCRYSDEFTILWIFTALSLFAFCMVTILCRERRPKITRVYYSRDSTSSNGSSYVDPHDYDGYGI